MTKTELLNYVRDTYSVDPDYPWDDEGYVLRHVSRKWFAVGMKVPYIRLGLKRDGTADIIDVKCSPLMMGEYLQQPGKKHRVTYELIRELIEISYHLTRDRKTGQKK